MTDLEVRIEALDPILFGDNRPARAGEDSDQVDQDPSPLTLYGAVGARIAAACGVSGPDRWPRVEPILGKFRDRPGEPDPDSFALLGYTLADAEGNPWFPKPLHLRLEEVNGSPWPQDRLEPQPFPPGVESSSPYPRRLMEATPLEREWEAPCWVDRHLLAQTLCGELESRESRSLDPAAGKTFLAEGRIGLALDNRTDTTVSGRLFSRPYRRFASQVARDGSWAAAGYVAWVWVRDLAQRSAADLSGLGFLGGDRGRAHLAFAEAAPLEGLRLKVEEAAAGACEGFFLYLLTPALAADGLWPAVEGRTPEAVAVGQERWVSGWNGAQHRPRQSRVLVPEGSVAFYRWPEDRPDGAARRDLVRERWLQPLADRFSNEGFGRTLVGVWGRHA